MMMDEKEIIKEIESHYEIHKNDSLKAFYLSLGYLKGLHASRGINTPLFIELVERLKEIDHEKG